jgi:hypothetical protein
MKNKEKLAEDFANLMIHGMEDDELKRLMKSNCHASFISGFDAGRSATVEYFKKTPMCELAKQIGEEDIDEHRAKT